MNSFICPECNSKDYKSTIYVSTIPDPNDPWSSVLQQIECAKCLKYIPAHIGERWNNISIEEAKNEWKSIYNKIV